MDLVLIRHPEVAIAPGICYGRLDLPLRDTPSDAAAPLINGIARRPWTIRSIHASPLQRCAAIAACLGSAIAQPVIYDMRLAEMDFGRWEGCSWDTVPRQELDAWANDIAHARPHGGESPAQVAARAVQWFDEWRGRDGISQNSITQSEAVPSDVFNDVHIVIAHAGVIRLLSAYLLQRPMLACLDWPLGVSAWSHFRMPARDTPTAAWLPLAWNHAWSDGSPV